MDRPTKSNKEKRREGESTSFQQENEKNVKLIPGLIYERDFLTLVEETEICRLLDEQEWATDLKRRVQQYGYTFNHESQHVKITTKTPPMPDWLDFVLDRLIAKNYFQVKPDQLIVNEYEVGQGINPHIDKTHCFGPIVVTIGMLSSCTINFSNPSTNQKIPIFMERRSIVVLTGDARFIWKHGITGAGSDFIGQKEFKRKKRISITFRNMIQEYLDAQRITSKKQIENENENNDKEINP